ncbi:MAG: restriction endonuclease [Bacteroidetes bacterium]|nr:restriction endonuclease [Bacteroidota bacterium]
MNKKQTDRLSKQHEKSQGPKGIFGESAQIHDTSVNDFSKMAFETLKKEFPDFEFRLRNHIKKKEINNKLNKVDSRLGVTIFVDKSAIKPDGGIIEVKDNDNKWRIVLVCEAKHQGKDIENISEGILVGKNKDQDIMVAGNAIERSHKNINEIRNIMIDEKHFPYILFLQGSNFLTEPTTVIRPDGREIVLRHNIGSLNRIDRLTSANYSLPINQNSCENIFITIHGQTVMLQAVSIYAKATQWTVDEMLQIMMEIANTSLRIIGIQK